MATLISERDTRDGEENFFGRRDWYAPVMGKLMFVEVLSNFISSCHAAIMPSTIMI